MNDCSEKPLEKEEFALELEGRTTVVHRTSCVEMKHVIESDQKNSNWIFPFKTYKEAFEYGEKLENRSYPKSCGKCTPWKSSTIPQSFAHEFVLPNEDIIGVFNGCRSWLIAIGAKMSEVNEPRLLRAKYTPPRANSSLAYAIDHYLIEIQIEEVTNDIKIKMEIEYSSPPNLSYVASGLYEISGFKKLGEDLEEYVSAVQVEIEREDSILSLIIDAFRNLRVRRSPLARYSWELDKHTEEPFESRNLVMFIAIGLVLIYAAFFFRFTDQFTENIVELIFTYGAAAGFIYWVYLSDKREREPIAYILLMFCWGIFSGLIAAPLNSAMGAVIGEATSLAAPLTEESIKALGLYVFLTHKRFREEFNSPLDGIIYGLAVGMGFYASENFVYYLHYSFGTLFLRILFCWGHGLWVAIVGLWIAVARHNRGYNVPLDLIPGLFVAMFLHFLWNLLSFIGLMTGRIIFYFALWQLNYLRRMIREGKSDEMLRGERDRMVFTNLNIEDANKRSHSNKLLLFLLIITILSLIHYGTEIIVGRSEKWVTTEFMDFSFDHPERMDMETWGRNETEADEWQGSLWLTYSLFNEFEAVYIEYIKTFNNTIWETDYDQYIVGEEINLEEEGSFKKFMHDGLYRNCTTKLGDMEVSCVASAWYCPRSTRIFYVEYYSTEEHAYIQWRRVIESFECH